MATKAPYNWSAYIDYPKYYYDLEDYEYVFDEKRFISEKGARANLYLAISVIVINVLHSFILLRKQLRSNAVFIYMIAVALVDIISFSLSQSEFINLTEMEPLPVANLQESNCLTENWALVDYLGQFISTSYGITRRMSIWLALLMAFTRTVSIMFPMSNSVQKWVKPGKAIFTILFVFMICFVMETRKLFWNARIFQLQDILPERCHPPEEELTKYNLFIPREIVMFTTSESKQIELGIKIFPVLLFPILSVLLFMELRKIRKRRKNMGNHDENKKSDNTSTLIFFITISFMITEMLAAFAAFLTFTNSIWVHWDNEDTIRTIHTASSVFSLTMRSINAISHPIICFFLSSQYRDTVKSIFCNNRVSEKAMKMIKFNKIDSNKTDSDPSQISPTIQT